MTEQERDSIIDQEAIIAKLTVALDNETPGTDRYGAIMDDRAKAVRTLNEYKQNIWDRSKIEAETNKVLEPQKWYEQKWFDHVMRFGEKVVFGGVMIGYMIVNEHGVPDKITQSTFGKWFSKDI